MVSGYSDSLSRFCVPLLPEPQPRKAYFALRRSFVGFRPVRPERSFHDFLVEPSERKAARPSLQQNRSISVFSALFFRFVLINSEEVFRVHLLLFIAYILVIDPPRKFVRYSFPHGF